MISGLHPPLSSATVPHVGLPDSWYPAGFQRAVTDAAVDEEGDAGADSRAAR